MADGDGALGDDGRVPRGPVQDCQFAQRGRGFQDRQHHLDPGDIAWCHPVVNGSQGSIGDPVVVYIWRDGAEGYEFTLAPSTGIFNALGVNSITVNMSPEARARLEKSVATPVNCPAGVG